MFESQKYYHRWKSDTKIAGPFPHSFEHYARTLRDCRKTRFGKSPVSAIEIQTAFQNQELRDDLGTSLFGKREQLFNEIVIEKDFSNCFFSSAKSIALVKEFMEPHERFFVMDATFRVTPIGEFEQVLVLYVQFGIKVKSQFI